MFFFIKQISNSEIFKQLLKMEKIMSENQAKIDALAAQLQKAKAEIVAEIEALKNQPGAEVLNFSALESAAQGLDDLNPDDPVV
jgi:predicted  nucleic acid-binding Zn-ribbon protein